jgi:hypothetical protein
MPPHTSIHMRVVTTALAALTLCVAVGTSRPAHADVLLLRNGSRVEGNIDKVDRATGIVTVRTAEGLVRDVRLVDLKFDSWLKIVVADTKATDAPGWMEIAGRCLREEHFDRARKYYERALPKYASRLLDTGVLQAQVHTIGVYRLCQFYIIINNKRGTVALAKQFEAGCVL